MTQTWPTTQMYDRVLTARETIVLEQRRSGSTHQEIGQAMGYTRERVRQLERNATRRLCTHPLRPDPTHQPAQQHTPQWLYDHERFGPPSDPTR